MHTKLKKLVLKHVRKLRYFHFPTFVQCTKGGKSHFCSNSNEISRACLNIKIIKYYHRIACKKTKPIFWKYPSIRANQKWFLNMGNHHILWVCEKNLKIHHSDSSQQPRFICCVRYSVILQ